MKQSLLPALTLVLSITITFTGCGNGLSPEAGAARAAVDNAGSQSPAAATVSGPLAIIDGAFTVLYQGNVYHIKGLGDLASDIDIAEGADLTIKGETVPILDRDTGGNSLFYGYYLQAEQVSLN
jgi:hypothetical protein